MKIHVNLAVVACIVALAVLLGILNNLRVADERKVGWFGAPADDADFETTKALRSEGGEEEREGLTPLVE